jgi:hypothetical protein
MAILHYRVSQIDHSWIVSCEDVPIEEFEKRIDAVGAVTKLVNTARHQGNHALLHIDHARSRPATENR